MGAGTIQKGALGQQLAASGRARRADQIGRSKEGPRRGGPGRDRSRAVIEDQMDQNDATGKQKQGKRGRPGKPIGRPIEEGGRPFPPKEGRPFEPPMEGRPFPPMEGRPLPPKEGRPPRDGDARILPYFPGEGSLPGKPPVEGRPGAGKPDRRKEEWMRRRKEMEMKKGGGTDFGPGRGSRIPEGADQGRPIGNDQLPKGFKGGGFLQDFLARISQLKGGGIK